MQRKPFLALLASGLLASLVATHALAGPVVYLTGDDLLTEISRSGAISKFRVGLEPTSLAFSPDERQLFIADEAYRGGAIFVRTPLANASLGLLRIGAPVYELAVHPREPRLYAVNVLGVPTHGASARVTVIDTQFVPIKIVATIPVPDGTYRVTIDPSGSRVYAMSGGLYPPVSHMGGILTVIDTTTNTAAATVPLPSLVDAMIIHPDGKRAYLADQNDVYVLDTETLSILSRLAVHEANEMAIHPTGAELYVSNFCQLGDDACDLPGAVTVIDTATNTITAEVPVGRRPQQIAVAPNGRRLWVTHGSDKLYVVRLGCRPRVVRRLLLSPV